MQKIILVLALVLAVSFAEDLVAFQAKLSSFHVECGKHEGHGHDFAENVLRTINHALQPEGYCTMVWPGFTWPTSNAAMCGGPNENIGWKFEQTWFQNEDACYVINFGTDFGRGGAVFVDGNFYSGKSHGLWWAGDWNNDGVLTVNECFSSGYHKIMIVGSEECCDGLMDCQFSKNGGDFQSCNSFDDTVGCADVTCDKVTLYSECCYGGSTHTVDEDVDDECLDFEPKSICIPEDKQATFYDLCQFEGQAVTFVSSVSCLDSISFDLLAKYGIKTQGKKAKHLKTNAEKTQMKIEVMNL